MRDKTPDWAQEIDCLKSVMAQTPLVETVKWGVPVYTLAGKNLVGIAGFKNFLSLWFYNGVFLKDPANVLYNAQDEKTKALRQWRFENLEQIRSHEETILAYVREAIANEEAGLSHKPVKKELVIPPALQSRLNDNPQLYEAFYNLTPGRQRDYADFISGAKREATQLSRLEKIEPLILAGVGLNDQYK